MKNLYSLLMVFGLLAFLVWPNSSYADWGRGHYGYHGTHHYYRYHDHPHFGVHVSAFYPDEYYPIWVGGARYYYDDGVYYNYIGGNYVVATPPVGAVVSAVPSDFQPVVVNGVTYYADNGTYYVRTSSGYKVVPMPNIQPEPITVNVPNRQGGYVAVILKRSGTGFIGPQGEFYASFPQVSQLQVVYGR